MYRTYEERDRRFTHLGWELRRIRARCRIKKPTIVERVHLEFPSLDKEEIDNCIMGFEYFVRRCYEKIISGKGPERCIFLSYLNNLNLTSNELGEIESMMRLVIPNFQITFDGIPSIQDKLNMIPKMYRDRIENLIDRLYNRRVKVE